jgi:hypothetical protein
MYLLINFLWIKNLEFFFLPMFFYVDLSHFGGGQCGPGIWSRASCLQSSAVPL